MTDFQQRAVTHLRKWCLFPICTKLWFVVAMGLVEWVQGKSVAEPTTCERAGLEGRGITHTHTVPGGHYRSLGSGSASDSQLLLFFPPWAQMRPS